MDSTAPLDAAARQRSLANLKLERDAVVLYERLGQIERDPERALAFRTIAANERRHADVWATRLREAGVDVPPPAPPRLRVRFVVAVARLFGTRAVSDLVRTMEGDEEALYNAQEGPEMAAIAADEREHAAIWHRLDAGMPALVADGADLSGQVAEAGPAAGSSVSAREEGWHVSGRSGTLRAAIFGINDGLVSNLALVMGVAGASTENQLIVLAGVAGLLAGAFSMAAGEYISMRSQRELFERQIELEREELRLMPEFEQAELSRIYQAKGLTRDEADLVAKRLMQDPEHALDTKIREELGLDPSELGSPSGAAWWSFVAFAIGAMIPLVPFLLTSGMTAIAISVVLALTSLFAVGAAVSFLTGRSLLFSGARQVAIGGVAALVTYLVGSLLPVDLG
jgi:VIT1/CCC1 family predicted Fe2+/Mn2+ transporter